jgi:hypothetical protein
MITGETEQLLDNYLQDEYDDFLGSKKKRRARRAKRKTKRLAKRTVRRSQPKVFERKAKRTKFFKDVGQMYRDAGGATAIGQAIDAITTPKPLDTYGSSNNADLPSDFSIGLGGEKEPEPEKKGIPTVVYVLGGVVVVGVIGLTVMSSQKNKQYQQY